jgi:hypothetical protein
MAEFQEELGFPPAPKLDVFGKLDPSKATAAELRGQEVVFGKGQCGTCHAAPYYTDNLMHDLKTERGGHAGAGDAAHVLDDAMDRSVLVERPMSPRCNRRSTCSESGASVPRPRRPHGRRVSRRIDPISLSAKPLCQGDPGAMGLSRMPMARSRRMTAAPWTRSRSRIR